MREVANEEIEKYRALCETLARPFIGQAKAEADDLVQEGLIHVWLRLRSGKVPAAKFIRFRMSNWCRFLRMQDRGEDASYNETMHDAEDWLLA